MATNTFASNFSSDVATYIAEKTLMIALKELALYQLLDKAVLPHNSSRTFQYTRYDRLSLPQSALSEGVTPSDTSMGISTVQAVMDQWGAVVPLSDVAIDSVKHPVLQKAIELLAYQMRETLDREIAIVLLSGTNVYFPNAISSRPNLTTSDKLDSNVVGKVTSAQRAAGARPLDGTHYVGVVDSWSEDDLIKDSTFVLAAQYNNVKLLYNQEIGMWKGVRWIRSNTLPSLGFLASPTTASSATAGSLVASTTYDMKLSVVSASTGHEIFMSAKFSQATGGAQTSIDITIPALPSGSPAGSTFKVYAGASSGTLYLQGSGIAASSTYNLKTIPTSGVVAQANAPSGVRVHHAFIFGKEAVTCVELNKMKAYLTPAVPSDSDPLVQRRKAGWKADFKAVICNDNFLARIEHYTSNGANP